MEVLLLCFESLVYFDLERRKPSYFCVLSPQLFAMYMEVWNLPYEDIQTKFKYGASYFGTISDQELKEW